MTFEDKYCKILEKLYSQTPSFQVVGSSAYHPGLKTMRDFASLMENPFERYKTIHIAGTNGKGSVAHFLASVYSSKGLKTGLYTSPHLLDFRERIKIDGKIVSKQFVVDFLERYDSFISEHNPSFFEITTAMAFEYFAVEKVDIAVIETGLGGRLDSTNLITPEVSIITSIGLDHCGLLGDTMEKIAVEKGGIIKPRVPVVVGSVSPSVKAVLQEIAAEKEAPFHYAPDESGITFEDFQHLQKSMDLKGDYQYHNLQTAICALTTQNEILSDYEPIFHAASRTTLRGRFETLREDPKIICDIAHNPQGIAPVMEQFCALPYRRRFFIFGMASDKDVDSVISLLPKDSYFFWTQAKGSRAMSSQEIEKHFQKIFGDTIKGETTESVSDALNRYSAISQYGDLVYIGGSSYVVSEALEKF